jgi:hypothetical protein
MVNLIVGLAIWRRPSIFMYVAMWEHILSTVRFLRVAKLATLTPLSSLASCELPFPIVGLKSLPYLLRH